MHRDGASRNATATRSTPTSWCSSSVPRALRSKVTEHPNQLIDVEYITGPFRYLNNHWRFIEADDGGCIIDFYVDFEFKSRVLQRLIGLLFNEAVSRMVGAFETRARQLYGERDHAPPGGQLAPPGDVESVT